MTAATLQRTTPDTPASRREFASLPGVRLWFTDTGGSGEPIVLMHAITGTSESWAPQIGAFSKAGYRVIAFDRRGWGRSQADPATGPQPGHAADDLHALADFLALGRFHLVGVAGGGFVALDYAAAHPERLSSLVVAASTGSVSDKEIQDVIARIEIPGIRSLAGSFPRGGRVVSRHQSRGHETLARDRRTRATARCADPAAAIAEHLRQAGHDHHADAGRRRGCRSDRAACDS